MDLFLTNLQPFAFHLTICYLLDWSYVEYCDVFFSCLDSHSDGTHSLQDALVICFDEETNLFKFLFDWGWVNNYPFNNTHT